MRSAQASVLPNADQYSDEEVWDACKEVLATRTNPLEVRNVAEASGLSENEVIGALIRGSLPRGEAVIFRFPPLPCAAIIAVGAVTHIRPS